MLADNLKLKNFDGQYFCNRDIEYEEIIGIYSTAYTETYLPMPKTKNTKIAWANTYAGKIHLLTGLHIGLKADVKNIPRCVRCGVHVSTLR